MRPGPHARGDGGFGRDVYDWDAPVEGIALLLTEDGHGAFRALYGDEVVYAFALVESTGPSTGTSELPDDRAVRTGRTLVGALIAGEQVDVLRLHVHRSIALSMSALAAVVHASPWELKPAAPMRGPGWIRFAIVGDGRVGTIGIAFLRDNDRWFITGVDLRVGG